MNASISEEDKVFINLKFGEPNPSKAFYLSLPDAFLLEYRYTKYNPLEDQEYWVEKPGSWLSPQGFDKERLYREINEYLKRD